MTSEQKKVAQGLINDLLKYSDEDSEVCADLISEYYDLLIKLKDYLND